MPVVSLSNAEIKLMRNLIRVEVDRVKKQVDGISAKGTFDIDNYFMMLTDLDKRLGLRMKEN